MTEAESTRNRGEEWTDDDVQQLHELADGNTTTGVISLRLGRNEDAVRAKAQDEGISLAPANRRPTATCRSDQAHSEVMNDDGWTCAKCDGATDVALHSRRCPLRGQDQDVSVVDWSAVQILQRRPAARDDDASPLPQV